MIRNYFKIAFRSLVRNKSYTVINIAGLAIGIAVCMMIFVIIQFHSSFDNFHVNKESTYRVVTEYGRETTTDIAFSKDVPFPMPRALKTAFPQIKEIAPVFASHNDQILITDNITNTTKTFKEDNGVFFTEPSFFKIFDYPLLAGTYESLKDPNNVLLTKEVAEKYFVDWKTAIGKTIKLEAGGNIFSHGTDVLKVSGILENIPPNTDFQLKLVVAFGSSTTEDMAKSTDWHDKSNANFGCYIMLPPNTFADNFNQQLRAFSRKFETAENKDSHKIQPLSEVHFDTQAGNYSNKTISNDLLNVFWLIAGFILLIACVNFVNLSTAQAVNRAKEVSVRKVLGSNKPQLQIQFLIETFVVVLISVLIAAIIINFSIPFTNQLLELSLTFNVLNNPSIIFFLFAITIVVTALAGFYPSLVLSSFNPVEALKSKISINAASGFSLRRGLVVFQFIFAQALIIGTFIIVKQMDYFMTQPLGFDKEAIINVPFRVDSLRISRLDFLRNKLMQQNGVKAVSYSSNTPVENGIETWNTLKFDNKIQDEEFKTITKFADHNYVSTYKLTLIAGRNLKPSGYTQEFLVNESLTKSLGISNPDDILNKQISIWNGLIKCKVVGVMKDFNDRSFHHDLAPLLITTNNTMYNQAGIKLEMKNISTTLQSVKNIFDQTFPNFAYDYKFLDEKIESFYKKEKQMLQLFKIFAFFTVFLSCLGLYGLATFMATHRTKEIGIRKVLGASVGGIVFSFLKEFIALMCIAFIISAPIAWYYMNQWLQDYSYRIEITWWIFAITGASLLAITLLTVSYQAIKAAMMNPVKSLKTE